MVNWHRWARPGQFERLARRLIYPSAILTALLLAIGIVYSFLLSPADFRQGESVRIMYIHVPNAWMALMAYSVVGISSIFYLIWHHPLASLAGQAAAIPGAVFTALALITGSLWGRPAWGAYWVWDARLTSVLVLFFFYLGYIMLRRAFTNSQRGEQAAAILAVVGIINLPIIKFSVDWWNTLHQPASITRLTTPAIDPSMLVPLLVMAAGLIMYFIMLFCIGICSGLAEKRYVRQLYQTARREINPCHL